MTYILVLGQKNYSSWSMRAWLLMRWLDLDFEVATVPLYTDQSRASVRALGGETGLVPVLKADDLVIWDTLSIFEYLEEAHGGVWPFDPVKRARARSLAGEVHSGLNALRAAMPLNTRARGRQPRSSAEVEADIARVKEIWTQYPGRYGSWLLGDFGAVDIMFAPVATRFQTYSVELDDAPATYQAQLLHTRLWRSGSPLERRNRMPSKSLKSGDSVLHGGASAPLLAKPHLRPHADSTQTTAWTTVMARGSSPAAPQTKD